MDNMEERIICEEAIYGENYNDYIFEYFDREAKQTYNRNITCIQEINQLISIAYIPAVGDPMTNRDGYEYQTIPKLFGLMDTSAAEAVGVLKVRRQPYVDLFGQGTLIGFVDTGIDYQHPAFRNADGSSRIIAIWDQNQRGGTPPANLYYGTEYLKEDINKALISDNPLEIVPQVDEIGHGTFLAGAAAGGIIESENFTGIAPQAELVVVKLKQAKNNLKKYFCVEEDKIAYSEADIMLGIRYVLERARILVRPIVVLVGLGTNSGGHCGCLPLARYLDFICIRPGIAVVVAAGNEGSRGHHFEEKLLDETKELEVRIDEKETGISMEVWVEAPGLASVEVITPLGETTEKIPLVARGQDAIRFPLERTRIYVEYTLVEANARKELIFIRMLDPTPGVWRLRIFNEGEFKMGFNVWLPIENFVEQGTYFLEPEPFITICEPGNAARTMTITAYDHYSDSLYLNASRGYNIVGYVKPDFAAPGVNVYSTLPKGRYGRMTGSSVAAAIAAGCCSLMLEWGIVQENDLFLQTVRITNLFMRGARRKDIVYPNRELGYGEIDLYGVLEQIRFTT